MWDESAYEEVVCLECGKSLDDDCGHHLAVIAVTYGSCVGGAAADFWDGYSKQVCDALSPYAGNGLRPRWDRDEVQALWDSAMEDIGGFALPAGGFIDLMAIVLEEAGGSEHPGSLVSSSGAYSESRMRMLVATNPQTVCEQATKVLEKWLVPLSPDGASRG